MRSGNFVNALDSLVALVHEDNFTSLPYILEGILEIQNKGYDLSRDQLQKVKPFVDTYYENIQELAIKVYTNSLFRNTNLIKEEIDFINSKINTLEPMAREEVIGLLIKIFFEFSKYEKQLIRGLLTCLKDDLWNVRKKIIEFLNDNISERPTLINEFNIELEVLLDEKDIDVVREGLDFLLRLYIKTYTIEDLKKLIKSIPQREWFAQDKVMFLIGKLGIKRKELIKPVAKDLVYFLDHDDYLVNKRMSQTIEEIIVYHEDIFDDALFSLIQNDEIDNIEAIENFFSISIIKNGFERFFSIFKTISPKTESIIKVINNVIKKLYTTNPKLIETLFSHLMREILKDLNNSYYIKSKLFLELFNQHNIYLICYQVLYNIDKLDNSEDEERRIELISFINEAIPGLGLQKFSIWLDLKLQQGPVDIDDLCKELRVLKSQFIEILKQLMRKGLFHATIFNNKLKLHKSATDQNNDILFFKKWKIILEPEFKIKLFVLLKNTSGRKITDLSIILDIPQYLLIEQKYKEVHIKILDTLSPNQQISLRWSLQKSHDGAPNPFVSNIMVIIIYQLEGKIFSIEENLDIMLL